MDNIHYDWHIKDGNRVNKQIFLINKCCSNNKK